MSKKMLNNVRHSALKGGAYFANWDILMSWFAHPPYEIAILGNEYEAIRKEFNQHYLPQVLFSGGKNEGGLALLQGKLIEGQTTIYVCQDKVCKLPVIEVNEALKQMHVSPAVKKKN
jgi:uncharacterized protein YyaL (SSP411 family)